MQRESRGAGGWTGWRGTWTALRHDRRRWQAMGLYWFETFYRIGSYIFGGGQVVLPLIVEQVVQYKDECIMVTEKEICTRKPDYEVYPAGDPRIQSWMTEAQFLAGLGIAQVLSWSVASVGASKQAVCDLGEVGPADTVTAARPCRARSSIFRPTSGLSLQRAQVR